MLIKLYGVIINAGVKANIKFAQLLPAAIQAEKSPETGIKIINPLAKLVITDLATISKKYLPLDVYDKLGTTAISAIKKFKITKEMIEEFANVIESGDIVACSLYRTMASQSGIDLDESSETEFDYEVDPSNVYGSYSATAETSIKTSITNTNDVQTILEKIFL